MYIDAETIVQAAKVLGALGTVAGVVIAAYKFVDRDKKQSAKIMAIQKEQTLICYGILACLKGLKEQGCNKITIIEGNKGNAVAHRTLQVNGRYIRGYGLPDYAGKAAKDGGGAQETTKATKYTVVAGDTLSKIAAKHGTTVANLAAFNEISNPNMIRVGQVIHLTAEAAATAKLEKLGVINSPDYWAAEAPKMQYLGTLLVKAAEVITKAGPRTKTPEEGVAALVSAGIINTPAYWLANYRTLPNLGLLLCALGGAVK